jgi:hypothetical protein
MDSRSSDILEEDELFTRIMISTSVISSPSTNNVERTRSIGFGRIGVVGGESSIARGVSVCESGNGGGGSLITSNSDIIRNGD